MTNSRQLVPTVGPMQCGVEFLEGTFLRIEKFRPAQRKVPADSSKSSAKFIEKVPAGLLEGSGQFVEKFRLVH